ncbi:glycosyltransferase [Flavobacteriales bacterium]|nr:glycosyltransferase [Flavobacteriales bacterium]
MITIEASHISFGGGYVLLLELLENLSSRSLSNNVFIAKEGVYIDLKNKQFKNSNLILTNTLKTLLRYTRKRERVLYFSNLPPFTKNKKSIVYFHNELILDKKHNNLNLNLKYFIFFQWIKFFIGNVDTVACQTNNIFDALRKVGVENISKLPFFKIYNPLETNTKKYTFCYICSAGQHKNVERLFEAIKLLIVKYSITLAVTIENCKINKQLIRQLEEINKNANKNVIINYGLVSKEKVLEIYQASRALVFPSLKESMGLPLIEANMFGIKVLSSDLPYSHEILNPPIVFDPYETKEIAKTMELFINGKYDGITQILKIENKMEELIRNLKK